MNQEQPQVPPQAGTDATEATEATPPAEAPKLSRAQRRHPVQAAKQVGGQFNKTFKPNTNNIPAARPVRGAAKGR